MITLLNNACLSDEQHERCLPDALEPRGTLPLHLSLLWSQDAPDGDPKKTLKAHVITVIDDSARRACLAQSLICETNRCQISCQNSTCVKAHMRCL